MSCFYGHTIFPHFNFPTTIPRKRKSNIIGNHHTQDLLIITSKISHYLLQILDQRRGKKPDHEGIRDFLKLTNDAGSRESL